MKRRNNTIIGLTSLVLVTIIVHVLFFSNNLKVEVYNKTIYDIDSLKIGNQYINLKRQSSLLVENCGSISIQANLPFGMPEGNIKGREKDTLEFIYCGTGVETINNGEYQFDINVQESENFYRLIWQNHE